MTFAILMKTDKHTLGYNSMIIVFTGTPFLQIEILVMLLFFYQVFLLAYEEVELYSSISVDRQPFKQSVNHFQHLATFFRVGQDSHHLHLDV